MFNRRAYKIGGTVVVALCLVGFWLRWPMQQVTQSAAWADGAVATTAVAQPQVTPTADAFLFQQLGVYTATTRLSAIAVADGHAFVGAPDALLALDVGDPRAIALAGSYATDGGTAAHFAHGSTAQLFMAVARGDLLGGPYLELLDINEPAAIRRLAGYVPAALFITDLHRPFGSTELYVSERAGDDPALTILDATVPAADSPTLQLRHRITSALPGTIEAGLGNSLIFNHGAAGIALRTADISATVVSTLDLAGGDAMARQGRYLYRLSGDGALQIIDLSQPSRLVLTNTVDGFPTAGQMVLDAYRGRLFITQRDSSTTNGGGLRAYDLVDPLAPAPAGHYLEQGLHPSGLARVVETLYVTSFDIDDGLRVLRYVPTAILELAAIFDIEINGQRLNRGDTAEVTDKFTLRMPELASSATLRGKCIESLIALIRLEAALTTLDVEFAAFDVFVEMVAAKESQLCAGAQASTLLGEDAPLARVELRMGEGGVHLRPGVVPVRIVLVTPDATISASGRNDFIVRHDATAARTTLEVYGGAVTITPKDSRLPATTLRVGQAIDVTADAVGEIRTVGHALYLPLILR